MSEKKDDAIKNEVQAKGKSDAKGEISSNIVFKIDMHCEGCAKKIRRFAMKIDGVTEVRTDFQSSKLTVTSNVDASKLQKKIAEKMKKNVELIPPQKKDAPEKKKNTEKKIDPKKPKEPPISTLIVKTKLHCDGCIRKTKQIVSKLEGVHEVNVDPEKDLITMKGTMDAKQVIPYLQQKLKRNVEVVPAKKDNKLDVEKKEIKPDGEKKENRSGGEKKTKKAGGDAGAPAESKVEAHKIQNYYQPYDYGHVYDPGCPMYSQPFNPDHQPIQPVQYVHAPQMFSDENPNACLIM